jgi:hypothetical protein
MARHSARKISEHSAVLQRGSEFGGDNDTGALLRQRKSQLVEALDPKQLALCVCKR